MKYNFFSLTLRWAIPSLCLVACLQAGADELDDEVKQACSGLSSRFNSGSTKSDPQDDEIAKAADSNTDLHALIARARFTGSARACGGDTKAAETRLDATAATIFAASAPKTKRLVQILHCTEARTAREAASHWDSQQFCTQSQRNFDNYVTHNQPPP